MQIVAQGQTVSAAYPAVHEYFIAAGVLTDVFSAEFRVFPVGADGVVGAQVVPADEDDAVPVGMVADRIGPGHYAAAFEVDADDMDVGRYKAVWTVVVVEDDDPITFETAFEVVEALATTGPLYASVASMRAEGVPSTVADYVIHAKLVGAARQFDAYTRRFFEPRYKMLLIDGKNSEDLLLQEPIIGIEAVRIVGNTFASSSDIALEELRVYNRHLTQDLILPDDRVSPKISWGRSDEFYNPELTITNRRWPRGRQNISVKGVFGYTEYDGTATGAVPWMVSHAVRLMAIKDLPLLTSTSDREDARRRWALTGERTRDQSYTLFSGVDAASRGATIGAITGDPEIDRILVLYMRTPAMGAA